MENVIQPKKIYQVLSDIQQDKINGEQIHVVAEVKSSEQKYTKYGKRYVTYYLTDGYNVIRATDFDPSGSVTGGNSVELKGRVEEFNGRPYINIEEIRQESGVDSCIRVDKVKRFSVSTITRRCQELGVSDYRIKHRENYIAVEGEIIYKFNGTTKWGNDYITYQLSDGGDVLYVRDFDLRGCEMEVGERVEVQGFLGMYMGQPFLNYETSTLLEEENIEFTEEDLEYLPKEVEGETEIEQVPVSQFETEGDEVDDSEEIMLEEVTELQPLEDGLLPSTGFQILIEDRLMERVKYFNHVDQNRLHKALLNLQYNRWDLGVKVKQLSGVRGEVVFEARLDRDRRILFLVKQVPVKDQTTTAPSIVIADIVRHKNINRGANRLAKKVVERLNLQPYTTHLIDEGEIEQDVNRMTPEVLEKYPSLIHVFDKEYHDSELQEEDETGLPSGIRYYRFDPEIRKEWIKNSFLAKELALSRYQQNIVYSQGPLLINGGAGTGKTTVLAHIFVFRSKQKYEEVLYITLTRPLRRFIEEIVSGMHRDDSVQKRIVTFADLCLGLIGSHRTKFPEENESDVLDFLGWIRNYPKYSDIDPLKIWQEYYGILKGRCLDHQQGMLDEKEYLQLGEKVSLFDKEERKRVWKIARQYFHHQREEGRWDLVDLAQFTYNLFESSEDREEKMLDGIICDEIQDFVMVQYSLFNRLVKLQNQRNLYFGGDSQQTINSSNFRWEDVKTFLHDALQYERERHGLKDVIIMSRNFRSTSKMIEFANSFIRLKKDMGFGEDSDYLQQSSGDMDVKMQPALLLEGSKDELLRVLEEYDEETKGRMAIVYSASSKQLLSRYIGEKMVLTIAEAKGLEFNTTFLFNIATDSQVDWRKILDEGVQDKYIDDNYLHIKYVLNRMYVAITRARRDLIIYESGAYAKEFWSQLLKKSCFRKVSMDLLVKIWGEDLSKEDLIKDGNYFMINERYDIAADRFKRAGDRRRYKIALAHDLRKQQNYKEAAKLFSEVGEKEDAAWCYLQFNPTRARRLYAELGDDRMVGKCEAAELKQRGLMTQAAEKYAEFEFYEEAMKIYEELGMKKEMYRAKALLHESYGEWTDAIKAWDEAGDMTRKNIAILRKLEKGKKYTEAASHAEKIRRWEDAERLWRKAGDLKRAEVCQARAFEKTGEFSRAEQIYRKHRLLTDLTTMWVRCGDYEKAALVAEERLADEEDDKLREECARLWTKVGNIERALSHLEDSENHTLKAELLKEVGMHKESAEHFELALLPVLAAVEWVAAGEPSEAARCYEKGGQWTKAAEQWGTAGEPLQRAKALERGGKLSEAVSVYVQEEVWNEAARCCETLEDWEKAAEYWVAAGELEIAARSYERGELWIKVSDIWKKLGDEKRQALALMKGRRYMDAGDIFYSLEMYIEAAEAYRKEERSASSVRGRKILAKIGECYEKGGDLENAGKMYEEGRHYAEAASCWRRLKKYRKLALAEEELKHWGRAATAWKKLDRLDRAAECYEKKKSWDKAIELWEELGKIENVAMCYQRQKKYKEAGETWQSINSWKNAAAAFEKGGLHLEAAECWLKEDNFEQAARCCEEGGDLEKAVEYYRKAKKFQKAALLNKKLERWGEAARDWEEEKMWENAAELWEKEENYEEAARCWEKEKDWDKAFRCWSKVKRLDRQARCLEKKRRFKDAAILWAKSAEQSDKPKQWEYAGDMYHEANMETEAARCWEKCDNVEKRAKALERLGEYEESRKLYESMRKYSKVGELYAKEAKYREAAEAFEKAGALKKAGRYYAEVGDDENAVRCYKEGRHHRLLADHYRSKELWVVSAKEYEKGGHTEEAIECFEKAGMTEEVKRLKKNGRQKKNGRTGKRRSGGSKKSKKRKRSKRK